MNPLFDPRPLINRRHFFGRTGFGATALAALLNRDAKGAESSFDIRDEA